MYASRADLPSAQRAAELLVAELAARPDAFDAAWKLARVSYWLGGHLPQNDRRAALERGLAAGETASRLQPSRPEGHFWTAANMGALAESFGLRAGLKYRKPVREKLETVLRIAPAFQDGSADRALGRWYFRVPSLFGGSDKKAEAHLRASLTYDDESTLSRLFLAELLLEQDRKAEARTELQRVLDAPANPAWIPEDRENKDRARALLEKIR